MTSLDVFYNKKKTTKFAFVKGPLMVKTGIVFGMDLRVHLDNVNVKSQGKPVRVLSLKKQK